MAVKTKKKRIAVTGASGYLGIRLMEKLLADKNVESVIGLDVRPLDMNHKKLSFYPMDIRDRSMTDIFKKHGVDTVFHLAFIVTPIHDEALMHDVDLNGTANILTASADAGVRNIIAITSTLGYGAHRDNPPVLTENHPLRGNKSYPYGYNKAQTDKLIQDFARGNPKMTVTILRPCTVFGPTVNNYVSRMLFRPVTVSIMNHDAPVQFVHEDDFVDACLLAMIKMKGGAYNITGDGTLPTSEIARIMGTKTIPVPFFIMAPLLELLWRLHVPGIEVNRGYLEYIRFPFVAGNEKAKKELGFRPKYDSLETLMETVRVHKNVQD